MGLAIVGCGDNLRESALPPGSDRPVIDALSPDRALVGSPALTLTVTGQGFAPDARVVVDGLELATNVDGEGRLVADIAASELRQTGVLLVEVANPGGAVSQAVGFPVEVANPIPVAESTQPPFVDAGAGATTVTIHGEHFVAGAIVQWNGAPLATTLITSTTLLVDVPAGEVATAGMRSIVVENPPPGGGPSNAIAFDVRAVGLPGVLLRVSVAENGGEPDADCLHPATSATGRFVVFESNATNLVANDTNATTDVFVRDTCFGATACTPSTERVSVATDGTEANNASFTSAISADGRFVVFMSAASNLAANDANNDTDVFVRDTCRGASSCTPSTTRVSVTSANAEVSAPAHPGRALAISDDGRYVAWTAFLGALDGSDTNGVSDVYVRDTCTGATGCTPSTTRVSVANDGAEGAFDSVNPAMSGDGRWIAFSTASPLAANDTDTVNDVYVRDTCAGASSCTPSTTRVAATGLSEPRPALSATGNVVAFDSFIDNQAGGDMNAKIDSHVRVTCLGATGCTPMTLLASTDPAGFGGPYNHRSGSDVSGTGRFVLFSTKDPMVAGDTNNRVDSFVRDTCLGATSCTPSTTRVTIHQDGTQTVVDNFALEAVLARTGSVVVFASPANNLIAGDSGGFDVFLALTGR